MNVSPKTQAMNLADQFFSLWLRASHADEYGMVACSTCGKRMEWRPEDQSTHCGHYIPRKFFKTRYDPHNVAIQCWSCNIEKRGCHELLRTYLVKSHGEEAIQNIEATHRDNAPHNILDLIEIAEHYESLLNEVVVQKQLIYKSKQKNTMTKTFCDGCETEITHGSKSLTLQARKYEVCPECYRLVMEAAVAKLKSIKKA